MKELIEQYRRAIKSQWDDMQPERLYDFLEAQNCALPQRPSSITAWHDARHVLWMLDEMDKMLAQSGTCEQNCRTLEKLNRWLGFVQGVLWKDCFFDLDELRDQTRQINPQN